jgi:hypothetical protein
MRTYIFVIVNAAPFALPTSVLSQAVEFGPGGQNTFIPSPNYGYGADCTELREARLRKGELGEQYREICQGRHTPINPSDAKACAIRCGAVNEPQSK